MQIENQNDFLSPVALGLARPDIERLANSFARAYGFEAGMDLLKFAPRLGVTVFHRNVNESAEQAGASMVVMRPRDLRVYLEMNTSLESDRFGMAHDIGHYVLHYFVAQKRQGIAEVDMRPLRAFRDTVEDQSGSEASWFGSALLLPAAAFRQSVRRWGGSVSLVAHDFLVSDRLVEMRARVLGLAAALAGSPGRERASVPSLLS